MKKQNRRKFIAATALLGTSLAGLAGMAPAPVNNAKKKQQIIHHVLLWLKNPSSKEDLHTLIEGLRTLKKVETVRQMYIGVPAETKLRPGIDNTYSVSLLMFFDDLGGQEIYQNHAVHLKLLEDYSRLWERYVTYDSIEA